MCGSPQYTLADIRRAEHIEDFAEMRDRFEFVNWRSYFRHGSLEVRILHGSLNQTEICNWIRLHALFIDAVKDKTYRQLNRLFGTKITTYWTGLCQIIPSELTEYWQSRNNMLTQIEQVCEDVLEPTPEVLEIPADVVNAVANQLRHTWAGIPNSIAGLEFINDAINYYASRSADSEQQR
jgi:hypothetical protein